MDNVITFYHDRPGIGLQLTCTATPDVNTDGDTLWKLDASGVCQGHTIGYSEMWFHSAEDVMRSVEDTEDTFYLALLSYEAMETYESENFGDV